MYKPETIEKHNSMIIELVHEWTEKINAGYDVRVSLQSGNNKIGHTHTVSLPAVIGCPNCSGCKEYCYGIKDAVRFWLARNSRAKNWAILMTDRARYFRQIAEYIARRRAHKFFRWHVVGEIIDRDYLENMVAIALQFPEWKFWTYTKMYSVINRYVADGGFIPENLAIMFSEWRGMVMDNPYGFPEFRVLFDGETAPAGAWVCPGNCDICKAVNRGCVAGETSYNGLH